MKAAKYILTTVWVLLAAGYSIAQTNTADTAVKDSTIVIKTQLYDTGAPNPYCATCTETMEVNNSHVTPYYQDNKTYADANRTTNLKPGVLSQDGSKPSIRGARPSGTAYYYNGVRLLDSTPIRIPTSPF